MRAHIYLDKNTRNLVFFSLQMELEERRRQEANLARELEEANIMIEDQYASMADALEGKTRKLKKVWNKYQMAKSEIRDLSEEFQKERADMLDTIRELNKQLKLKQLLLDAFVPREESERIEARAVWDDDADEWGLRKLEISGNRIRIRRPPSTLSPSFTALYSALPMNTARPVSQLSLAKQQTDADPRYRVDNVANMELEWVGSGVLESPEDGQRLHVVGSTKRIMENPGSLPANANTTPLAPSNHANR